MTEAIARLAWLAFAAALAACAPEPLDAAAPEGAPALSLSLEPASPPEAAPLVVRLHLRASAGAGAALEPTAFALYTGELSSYQLGALARGEPSAALLERVVPASAWASSAGEAVLAPHAALAAGEPYTVASGEPAFAATLTVAEVDELPLLPLVWPPAGASPTGAVAIWCGEQPLADWRWPVAFDPGAVPAALVRGIGEGDIGSRCLRLAPEGSPEGWGGPLQPPVTVGEPPFARLEPHPLVRGDADVPVPIWLGCTGTAVRLGPGCATVLDDRLALETPPEPLLWSVVAIGPSARLERVEPSSGGTLVVGPLEPDAPHAVRVTVMDLAGRTETAFASIYTLAPRPHVLLNEVLANPLGPEPQQEWVELYNDGIAAADLAGYRLTDIGGEAVLPAAVLAPGGFALVVNDSFDPLLDYDPLPPPDALVLRVPKLGKGGLNNGGEPLRLYDLDGALVSTFPASPKPKPARSVYRRALARADDEPDAFATSPEGGATPAAPNPP